MEQLRDVMNRRDLAAFLSFMHRDYRSEQPAHPDRAFGGREQVRENWTAMFASMPDFTADLLGTAVSGDTVWAEWVWRGGAGDLEMRGVTLFRVRDGLIVGGRLYMEPVEHEGAGIRAAVQGLTERASRSIDQRG